jgi:hypothetical protein
LKSSTGDALRRSRPAIPEIQKDSPHASIVGAGWELHELAHIRHKPQMVLEKNRMFVPWLVNILIGFESNQCANPPSNYQ